jgi:HEAT repeat protein
VKEAAMTNPKAKVRRTFLALGVGAILAAVTTWSGLILDDRFHATVPPKVVIPTRTPNAFAYREPMVPPWASAKSDAEAVKICVAVLEEMLAKERPGPGTFGQYDEDERLQRAAIEELKRRGPAAASAVPTLIRTLKSINPLRSQGVYPGERELILGELILGERELVGAPDAAREALVAIGKPAIPALKKALTDDDALTRVHAARALWALEGNADEVAPVLMAAWHDEAAYHQDHNVRWEADRGLSEIAPGKRGTIVSHLAEALRGDSDELAASAAMALFRMSPSVPEALPPLLQALKGRRGFEVHWSSDSLTNQGAKAVPVLEKAIADSDEGVRGWAAWSLGRTGQREVIPLLVKATGDERALVRMNAVRGLGELYDKAIAAIPDLEKLLADPDEVVRKVAKNEVEKLKQRKQLNRVLSQQP